MKKGGKGIRIAALGDLHVHEKARHTHRDVFAQISKEADVLALCGDLTNLGLPEEARNLAAELESLQIPAVAVLGNHDHESGQVTEVREILRPRITFVDEDDFELGGISFVGVKGFGGGFNSHMLAAFGEDAVRAFVTEAVNESLRLERLLQRSNAARIVGVLHYSPVVDTVRGEPPEIHPFLGCSRLAEVLDRFPVAAVFHGHAHHGAEEGRTRGGIPVFNCSEALLRKLSPEAPFRVITLPAAPDLK